jgi:hypothetical protein
MNSKECFDCFWKENYSGIVPLGYVLREFFSDRWFRIHSLPNSKRYADSEDEMQAILDRQNTLISDLIGEQNNYILLLSTWSETQAANCFSKCNQAIVLDSICLDGNLYCLEKGYLNMAIVHKKWEANSIDDCLKIVANEGRIINFGSNESYWLLIVDTKQNRIIAPYDGGVDVFLNTTEERDSFRLKYTEWLSDHESGL